MSKRTLTCTLLLGAILLPVSLYAQEGRIAFSRSVKYEFELPERLPEEMREQMPTGKVTELLLFFNANESVMVTAPEIEREETQGAEGRLEGMATRLRRFSTSRSDQEELVASHVDFASGIMSEMRGFLGRRFLISDERPKYAWVLGSEQRRYLDHVVQKATAEHEGRSIEAWFTMEIPVPAGPGPFGGLPGMILLVSVDDGHTVYAASDVDLSGLRGYTIAAPTQGDMVTPEEYEEIVAEKLEELETMRAQRGSDRRRPFDR